MKKENLTTKEIMELIPHRYPFLLVDQVTCYEPGQSATGIKCVTMNEPFFQGHFPGNPIMPGVLIVEAMAQVGAIALMTDEKNQGKLAVFAGIDEIRFKRQVVPGDVLQMRVEIESMRRGIGKGVAVCQVGNELVCKGKLMFALVE